MKNLLIESVENAVEHYVYDCSLPLEERPLKKRVFKSGMAAANFLGVTPMRLYASKGMGHKIWSPIYKGWFAVRAKDSTKKIKPNGTP